MSEPRYHSGVAADPEETTPISRDVLDRELARSADSGEPAGDQRAEVGVSAPLGDRDTPESYRPDTARPAPSEAPAASVDGEPAAAGRMERINGYDRGGSGRRRDDLFGTDDGDARPPSGADIRDGNVAGPGGRSAPVADGPRRGGPGQGGPGRGGSGPAGLDQGGPRPSAPGAPARPVVGQGYDGQGYGGQGSGSTPAVGPVHPDRSIFGSDRGSPASGPGPGGPGPGGPGPGGSGRAGSGFRDAGPGPSGYASGTYQGDAATTAVVGGPRSGSTPSVPTVPTGVGSGTGSFVGGATLGSAAAARSGGRPGGRAGSAAGTRSPRRARLTVRHIDPWSTLKFSAVLSVALFVVWLIAVGVLYGVLDTMGVFGKINSLYGQIGGGSGGALITPGTVLGIAAVIGAVNIVLITALATIGAFIYNICSDLVGGIEVTLAERD